MKKFYNCLILILAVIAMTGCVSTKKIVYFQGSEEMFKEPHTIVQQYEMRIKPADQVLIKVTCNEPELLEIFSQEVVMGQGSGRINSSNIGGGTMSNAYGFTVSNDGKLTLPAIGKVFVSGLTCDEAARAIEKAIVETNDIKDPEVTVRLLNARVTVLGAAGSPRVVNLTSERNTIADVLAQCGDISDLGLRYKLKLYREVQGELTMYDLDMTKAEVFDSPAFYVQQNDLIYVEPNKSKSIKSSSFYTFLGAGSSVLGLIASITSLVLVLTRL